MGVSTMVNLELVEEAELSVVVFKFVVERECCFRGFSVLWGIGRQSRYYVRLDLGLLPGSKDSHIRVVYAQVTQKLVMGAGVGDEVAGRGSTEHGGGWEARSIWRRLV